MLPDGEVHMRSAEITRSDAPKNRAGFLLSFAQYACALVTSYSLRTFGWQ